MSKKFEIIKKKNLPDEAKITGFTFLKEPTEEDKEKNKYDFVEISNNNEIGCFLPKRKSWAFSKGYVKSDINEDTYIEVKSRFFILLILLFGILLCCLLLLRSCGAEKIDVPNQEDKPVFDLTIDDGAETGDRETMSKEEIEAMLNQKVQEGMINISMNLNPVFANGTSEGNLLIVNEEVNRHPQVIEIYRNDTNELVYKSGLIPVGSRVDYGKLSVDLDAGEYDCVAYFNSINEETGELLGKAGAEITLIVQK